MPGLVGRKCAHNDRYENSVFRAEIKRNAGADRLEMFLVLQRGPFRAQRNAPDCRFYTGFDS